MTALLNDGPQPVARTPDFHRSSRQPRLGLYWGKAPVLGFGDPSLAALELAPALA